MQVLKRKPGEEILVGGASIVVLSSSENEVRLGVSAPPRLQIHRRPPDNRRLSDAEIRELDELLVAG